MQTLGITWLDSLNPSPGNSLSAAKFLPRTTGEVLHVLAALAAIFCTLWLFLVLLPKLIRLLQDLRQPHTFLEITPPQATNVSPLSTAELFNLVAGLFASRPWLDRILLREPSYSFEIVSQKETGIRYILRAPSATADLLEKSLRSYLPGILVKEVRDYLPQKQDGHVSRFRLSRHFALPLSNQSHLKEHDPLAYLTGSMTQLKPGELMAIQVTLRPFKKSREVRHIRSLIGSNRFSDWNGRSGTALLGTFLEAITRLALAPLVLVADTLTGQPPLPSKRKIPLEETPGQIEMKEAMKAKLAQPLFEAAVRTLIVVSGKELAAREKGLKASFSGLLHPLGQSLRAASAWRLRLVQRFFHWQFRNRLGTNPITLSSSEVAALYHFPFTATSQTEDLIRVKSKELPAPLSLKNNKGLDVVFGKNTYANSATLVGLSDEDRSRHLYLLGQTGSGKSTVMYHMASDDMKKGRGLAVVDPHGDLAEDLLNVVPENRKGDLIYVNPFDVKYPVGINLLELTPFLDEDEQELEKELVCESVISIFRRVFSKDEHTDAHRIEYILRNTIYTAFTVEGATIFTIYDLLNSPEFRKPVVKALEDENLRHFWRQEFGKAGDYQVVKMVGGVTAKVGRFLFSPTAKRILEQPKSTINFDELLEKQKILICNLSEGKIGEDTAQLLGTTIIAKVHQAAVRRARKERSSRKPFYLFIDEFQNFATASFTRLLSGGRKFGLRVTIAEQSTAQQADTNITNVILANTGTVVCFRTASPVDEELMLAQFAPSIEPGDIGNLPRYRFYMRMSAVEPSAPFSGETLPMAVPRNEEHIGNMVAASRKNYAIRYEKTEKAGPVVRNKPLKKVVDKPVPDIELLP